MKKKSQMEIMGIAIVVVIISIVILFVVRWGVLREPAQHKKEFAQSEIASNLVNTMLSTTTECKGLTFSELFQDCAENPPGNIDCTGTSLYSCDYAESEAQKILAATLGVWGYKYEFTVKQGNTDIITPIGNTGGLKERKARTYPIAGGISATLAIYG